MVAQDITKHVRILHDTGNQAREMISTESRVEYAPPYLPRRSFHSEQAETARQGPCIMAHGMELGQHTNLRNLGRPFRRGDDQDWRTEGPVVDVKIRVKLGESAHHASRQIVAVCVGREAGHELGGLEQMPSDGMVGRH